MLGLLLRWVSHHTVVLRVAHDVGAGLGQYRLSTLMDTRQAQRPIVVLMIIVAEGLIIPFKAIPAIIEHLRARIVKHDWCT